MEICWKILLYFLLAGSCKNKRVDFQPRAHIHDSVPSVLEVSTLPEVADKLHKGGYLLTIPATNLQ